MTFTHTSRRSLRFAGTVLFSGILSLTLLTGQSFTEELSDFEKLLREAIQSNQEENEVQDSGNKVQETENDVQEPAKEEPKREKAEPNVAKVVPKSSSMVKPKQLDGGWESVKPNAAAEIDKDGGGRVLVADAAGTAPKAANTSVWDAEPETVKTGKAEPVKTENVQKDNTAQPAKSLWDTVAEEPKIAAKAEPEKAEPFAAVLKGEVEVKAVEPKEPVKTEVVKKEEPKTSLKPVEQKKVEQKSGFDISAILNLLEQDKSGDENVKSGELGVKSEETAKVAEKITEKPVDEVAGSPKIEITEIKPKTLPQAEPVKETPEPAKEMAKTEPKPEPKTETPKMEPKPETAKTEKKPEVKIPAFDGDLDETKWVAVNPDAVGDSFGKEKIKLMYDEIINGLKTRNITDRYNMWKNYARNTLRSTSGINTGSELDGRCRLEWYKKLYDDPIKSIFDADEFSRRLHDGLSGSHRHLAESMTLMRNKMDVPARNDDGVRFVECKTPFDAVNEVKRCLLNAQMGHARYLSTLTPAEKSELVKNLVPIFAGQGCVNGHTIPSRSVGRRLTDIMDKVDRAGLYDAAEALIPLTNTALLELLDKLPEDAFQTTMVSGQKVQRIYTAAGDIIIGGRENNVYDLESNDMKDVVCVIDLGGNDTYRDGTCNVDRPVFAVIDLHGNDVYTGSKPGIQGGSVLGVAFLLDAEGDDTYSAGDVAQGSTIGGAGMLFDFAGKDSYKGLRRVQGHALLGLGMLIDRKGNDNYHAALWAQGFGAPHGFGVLEDIEGDDHYYCGGLYLDSYPEHPGYDGWGQGIGAGIRQVANGGIGAILEGGGNDVYEVDYFGHGGGYWLGVGFARDFGGNDIRHGTTLSAYTGGPRQQSKWTRFANGFGCHYSLGYCFDDSGDDVYGGTIMGTGMAWDLSIGYLCDFSGNDKFTATGGMTQGVGAEGSIGILFNYGGDDQFMGRNQGYASGGITYHSVSNCGGNISFVINYGGNDQYGCGAKNNTYAQRGSQGGFLIDRPTDNEAAEELVALKELIEKREKEIADYDEMVKKGREEAAAKGRRYYPRTRRPIPVSADQQSRLGSVPDFGSAVSKAETEKNIK
ncbi:MAG: hypothetical protein LBN39_03200 [Planctomycetaceae bacterium]|jgi:hypothetical protein|nr:hypothetical protein [Planctomycetaceae bacterium]